MLFLYLQILQQNDSYITLLCHSLLSQYHQEIKHPKRIFTITRTYSNICQHLKMPTIKNKTSENNSVFL